MTRVWDEWYEYSNAATLHLPILLSKYPLKPIWIVQQGRHTLLNTTPDGADLLASSFGCFAFKDWVLFTWQLGDWLGLRTGLDFSANRKIVVLNCNGGEGVAL